jgi:ABC-type multidrug transport system fused ATPase/permease subunit
MSVSKRFIRHIRNRIFLRETSFNSYHKNENITLFGFISSILKGLRLLMFFYGLSGILVCVVDFSIAPIFSRVVVKAVENYTGPRDEIWGAIKWPFIMMFSIWVFNDIQARIFGWLYASKIEPTLDAKIKMFYIQRVMKNSYEYFLTEETGAVLSRMYGILYNVKYFLKQFVRYLLPNCVSILFLGFSFLTIHWMLGGIVLLHLVVTSFVMYFMIKKSFRISAKVTMAHTKTVSAITDVILNISSVMLFNKKRHEMSRMMRIQNNESHRIRKNLQHAEKMKIIFVFLSIFIVGFSYTYVEIQLYSKGIIQLGDVVFSFSGIGNYLALMYFIIMDFVDLVIEYGKVQEAVRQMNAGDVVLENSSGGCELEVREGRIEFKDITFGYTNNEDIFEKESLIIKPREKVGLVGKSGSGKTTFINLLLKNLEPDDGKIFIDGQDIRFVSDAELKKNIAVISQDTILFNRSVFENIKYGKEDATYEQVIEAAKLANAHDFIIDLDCGYHTIVGERGSNLSGGQRQRIVIARAILKDAPILILDEATSALDSENESLIQESLNKLMKDKTVISIAHRLPTLRRMDRIVVLKDGEVVEEGGHDELVNKVGGAYNEMWKTQVNSFLNE